MMAVAMLLLMMVVVTIDDDNEGNGDVADDEDDDAGDNSDDDDGDSVYDDGVDRDDEDDGYRYYDDGDDDDDFRTSSGQLRACPGYAAFRLVMTGSVHFSGWRGCAWIRPPPGITPGLQRQRRLGHRVAWAADVGGRGRSPRNGNGPHGSFGVACRGRRAPLSASRCDPGLGVRLGPRQGGFRALRWDGRL